MERNKPFANLFYFKRILRIGGTEQFLYEMAKKYHQYDLTVLYDEAEIEQLMRLKRLVRCIERESGSKYYAKKAFYNFNLDAIDQVEADEHYFVCHAIYQQIPLVPPITNPKLTGYIGVSDYACGELKKYAKYQGKDIEPIRIYNPLTLEKPDKVVRLISACRLDDKVKGGQRTLKLIEALDDYCEKYNRHYIWHIYTNAPDFTIKSPNVVIMPGRPDIRPFIADADYLVQLSNDMESYCYSINEALGYGTRIIRTPLTIAKELQIPKSAEIVANWDMSNVEEVVEAIFKPVKPFKYTPPEDEWGKTLLNTPSTYVYNSESIKIKPRTRYYDLQLQQQMDLWSEPFEVSEERALFLARQGLVDIVG